MPKFQIFVGKVELPTYFHNIELLLRCPFLMLSRLNRNNHRQTLQSGERVDYSTVIGVTLNAEDQWHLAFS